MAGVERACTLNYREYVGPIGVVVTTVLAETLRYFMSATVVTRRIDGVDVLPRTLFEQLFAGIVMFAVVKVGHTALPARSWTDLTVLIGLGAVTYGAVLLAASPGPRLTISSVYRDATG